MRMLLFMFFFRITWWIAPYKKRVDQLFRIYTELLKHEKEKSKCERRQRDKDACIRPRTPTYEHLSCKKQRKLYEKSMPPRVADVNQPMRHYSDYEEAQKYHEGKLN